MINYVSSLAHNMITLHFIMIKVILFNNKRMNFNFYLSIMKNERRMYERNKSVIKIKLFSYIMYWFSNFAKK